MFCDGKKVQAASHSVTGWEREGEGEVRWGNDYEEREREGGREGEREREEGGQ